MLSTQLPGQPFPHILFDEFCVSPFSQLIDSHILLPALKTPRCKINRKNNFCSSCKGVNRKRTGKSKQIYHPFPFGNCRNSFSRITMIEKKPHMLPVIKPDSEMQIMFFNSKGFGYWLSPVGKISKKLTLMGITQISFHNPAPNGTNT